MIINHPRRPTPALCASAPSRANHSPRRPISNLQFPIPHFTTTDPAYSSRRAETSARHEYKSSSYSHRHVPITPALCEYPTTCNRVKDFFPESRRDRKSCSKGSGRVSIVTASRCPVRFAYRSIQCGNHVASDPVSPPGIQRSSKLPNRHSALQGIEQIDTLTRGYYRDRLEQQVNIGISQKNACYSLGPETQVVCRPISRYHAIFSVNSKLCHTKTWSTHGSDHRLNHHWLGC